MEPTSGDQAAPSNDTDGNGWVELQDLLDAILQPIEDVLLDAIDGAGGRLLDVGCGTGGTTVAAARRLGPTSRCTGVDISEPMIAAARSRAERAGVAARFVTADAQRHRFEPHEVDVVISRLGVMFFDEPVEAFANIRTAARPGGLLRFVAWRGLEENPFMATARRAARPLLDHPAPDPPAQVAFSDAGRVDAILRAGGWADVDLQPVDVSCGMPAADLGRYLTTVGALAEVVAGADPSRTARALDIVLPAFEPFRVGDEIRFDTACWLVHATA